MPIFLFFMMTVLLSLEVVRFQSDMQEAVHQVGNQYAFAGYQIKYEHESPPNAIEQIKEYLSNQLYPYLCVTNSENGILFQDRSNINEDGSIELVIAYRLKPFIGWLPIGDIVIEDRFLSHAWMGYTGMETAGSGQQEIYVYITETGNKYHLSHACTYLRVQIRSADYEEIAALRNQWGETYQACMKCRPKGKGIVYFTSGGNRYHGQSDCSALKRTVYMIPLSKADSYSACSQCAGSGK